MSKRQSSLARLGAGALAAMLLITLAAPAAAHDGSRLAGGFAAGFIHPLSGLDHLLAMVAVGVWGAFLGRPLIVALPMLFPAAMALGGGIGMVGLPFPPVEAGIAISVLALGTAILFGVRASVPVACAIVAMFALFHGYAHGLELPAATDPVGYSAGFVLSTGLLHLAGIALGTLRSVPGGGAALRAGGGAMAGAGLWFLFMAVAR